MDQQARLKLPLQIHGSLGSVYLCIVECIPGSWFLGEELRTLLFRVIFGAFGCYFYLCVHYV
jgi:hypothetical protein